MSWYNTNFILFTKEQLNLLKFLNKIDFIRFIEKDIYYHPLNKEFSCAVYEVHFRSFLKPFIAKMFYCKSVFGKGGAYVNKRLAEVGIIDEIKEKYFET